MEKKQEFLSFQSCSSLVTLNDGLEVDEEEGLKDREHLLFERFHCFWGMMKQAREKQKMKWNAKPKRKNQNKNKKENTGKNEGKKRKTVLI